MRPVFISPEGEIWRDKPPAKPEVPEPTLTEIAQEEARRQSTNKSTNKVDDNV
jgi:hypothetical protein